MMPGGAQGYPDPPRRQTGLHGDGEGRTQSEKAGDMGDLSKTSHGRGRSFLSQGEGGEFWF